ncbi:hypothetical protein [Chlamydia felis Fe/C-56]|uniref:Uncharacterized protein n=1 Tax=Chlamydia felis (strain Fe/C-56) TaxID=264202 RepID=Q254P3_CHLFF|nr:hypothetical protein [Chlamydia felis]BAE81245.1 hypothetical protein [Chlamydia felis Fe/C-56]
MTASLDHLHSNSRVLVFFDTITGNKSTIYEISRCENSSLTRLINSEVTNSNPTINNLAVINGIFLSEAAPLFPERPTPAVQLTSDCSPWFSSQRSPCCNFSESSNFFLIFVQEICTIVNVIYQNTLGNVIRSAVSVCHLVHKSVLFHRQEKKILSLLKNSHISPFKKGGYIASATALNHAKKSAL